MPRYTASLTRAGSNTAGPQLYFQLRSNGTRLLRVVEVGLSISVAPTTAPLLQLARAVSSLGTASTSATTVSHLSDDAAGTGILESAWSGAPTITTTYMRNLGLPATAGGSFVWSFPVDAPLIIGTTATAHALQITNANASGTTTGTFGCYVTWDE